MNRLMRQKHYSLLFLAKCSLYLFDLPKMIGNSVMTIRPKCTRLTDAAVVGEEEGEDVDTGELDDAVEIGLES